MEAVVTVVCTGSGTHKRRPFNQFVVDGDQVAMREYRIGNMPELLGGEVDGAAVVHKAVLPPFYDPRVGHGRWRWECPQCNTRRLFSTTELRDWLQGRRVADISTESVNTPR